MTDKDTIISSQEAEILRLQQAFDELKNWVNANKRYLPEGQYGCWTSEEYLSSDDIIEQIDKITGASND